MSIEDGIQVLEPPYQQFTPFDPAHPPPTGTLALTPVQSEILTMERTLRYIFRRAPWLSMAVWTTAESRNELDISLQSVRLLTGVHAVLVVPADGQHPTPTEVVEGVARRTPPVAEHLAEWCSHRLGRPDLTEDLATALIPHGRLPAQGDDRALRRRLSREGLPPRLALGRLLPLAGSYRLRRTLTDLAAQLGLHPRQVRLWLDRLTGCTAEQWLQRPGWEWMVEEMIRRHGTRATRHPLPPPSPPSGPRSDG